MKKTNKKASADIIIMSLIFFVLVISIIIGVYVSNVLKDKLVENPVISNDTRATNAVVEGVGTVVKMADWICFVIFFAIILGIIITSFMFYSHPIFIAIYFILMIGGILAGVFMANIYEGIVLNTQLSSTATEIFPKTHYIISHYPFILLFVFIISVIIIYAKNPYGLK